MIRPAALTIGLATMLLTPAFAQKATPEQRGSFEEKPEFGTLHMTSNLGSFKIIPGKGRIDVTFTGTFLISGLKGERQVIGDLRKEFEGMEREVYHGTGRIVVEGEWRALQWFGSDMNAVWFGAGAIRVTGEFDKDLKTGEFWFDDPAQREYWATHLQQFFLPPFNPALQGGAQPTRRGSGGE